MDENLLLKTKKENLIEDFPKDINKNKLKKFKSLNIFWNRLVSRPQSFAQKPNSSISSMLDEEKNLLASYFIRSVLSEKLELPLNSKKLSEAMQECNKIFHEDYPFDFILEYQGKRLGMLILDKCYDSNHQEKLLYRFRSNLKSFEGLF
jgi:hypothetical protein